MHSKSLRFLRPALFSLICCAFGHQPPEEHSTSLISDAEDSLLIVSTLNGSLVAVKQKTGEILWRRDDEPAVKVPHNEMAVPMFLPDPKDGSLYLLGPEAEALKKLPFTIPQLVASSPCRSSDGILYTGRKIDTWFSVDPNTGEREQLLGFEKAESTCPLDTSDAIFVGRTEYNVIMIDSKRKDRKWNVTFYDYSAAKLDPVDSANYEYKFFADSSTGRLVTIDSRIGNALWDIDLKSPIIAVYAVSKDGLVSLPFTSVADCTLNNIIQKISLNPSDVELFPTLYVGEYNFGYYAIPSLVDTFSTTITNKAGKLLLEGPILSSQNEKNKSQNPNKIPPKSKVNNNNDENNNRGLEKDCANYSDLKKVMIIGHYEVPTEYKPHNQPLQITGRSDLIIPNEINISTNLVDMHFENNNQTTPEMKGWRKSVSLTYQTSKKWLNQQENKGLKLTLIILVGCLITMFWYFNARFEHLSQQYDQGSRDSSRTGSNGTKNNIQYAPEEVGEGLVRVGKVTFNTEEVLGTGCDGTFVYKGEFDGRLVAVKRLLPDCFTFADREVALLRETDAHANVVRYFCTEQDRMFRYIALELAEATLHDYVAGRYAKHTISSKSILRQATSGLAHLHSLDIVHRDIKPHNVLLSVPGPKGEVRAMISDFGLCKKLQVGRLSFSRRSGIRGTDGWIAPEMLNGTRTTCAVDIFSLGCVFYYVLSNGKHPFGDQLRRQANILSGEIDLSALQDISENDKQTALVLIKAMISEDPKERPPAQAIYDHPMFWDAAQVLTFFQDVSDRVEKDGPESPALQALESNNKTIVQGDWRLHIDVEVATDLRKYRSYRGESVRDLLRALRNKKHHYRELTPEAQKSLGEIPDKFTDYWLSRFPRLLIHSWCAMQNFRTEPTLKCYYDKVYKFKYEDIVEYPEIIESEEFDTIPTWRAPETVNWSPNRTRYRNTRRKHEKKKAEVPSVWGLPPES